MNNQRVPWQGRILGAVLVVLAMAGGVHLAWVLIRPFVPYLLVVAALLGIYSVVVRRRR